MQDYKKKNDAGNLYQPLTQQSIKKGINLFWIIAMVLSLIGTFAFYNDNHNNVAPDHSISPDMQSYIETFHLEVEEWGIE